VFVERIIFELPDALRGPGILTENILSPSPCRGVEKEQPFKNYTKFFGGNLGLEHLHPSTHTVFSSKNSQLAPSLPENLLA